MPSRWQTFRLLLKKPFLSKESLIVIDQALFLPFIVSFSQPLDRYYFVMLQFNCQVKYT